MSFLYLCPPDRRSPISASRRREGGGGHAPPRSARLRGPPPPFSRATSTSARCARRPIRWNAPLSLRYGALSRAKASRSALANCGSVARRRLAVQVLLAASPPASTARQLATSQNRWPAPRQRRRKSVLSSSGGERMPLDRHRRADETPTPSVCRLLLPASRQRLSFSKSQPARRRRRQRYAPPAPLDVFPGPPRAVSCARPSLSPAR